MKKNLSRVLVAFLEAGFDPQRPLEDGKSALQIAQVKGHGEALHLMRSFTARKAANATLDAMDEPDPTRHSKAGPRD